MTTGKNLARFPVDFPAGVFFRPPRQRAPAHSAPCAMPYLSRAADRPQITHGVQSGDVGADGGVVWARADRPSQMMVEVATIRIVSQCAGVAADRGAPRERLHRQNAAGKSPRRAGYFLSRQVPRPVAHRRFRANRSSAASAPRRPTGAMSASSGAAMSPDKAGASIPTTAACSPSPPCASTGRISCCIPATPSMPTASLPSEVKLADGKVWKNVTVPEKAKVAETLDEFRAAHKVQFPRRQCPRLQCRGADLRAVGRSRSHQQLVGVETAARRLQGTRHQLACRARRARSTRCIRCARASSSRAGSIARINYGPHLDVFMLDERSYRGPNGPNLQTAYGPDSYFLGPDQLAWLKRALAELRAPPGR